MIYRFDRCELDIGHHTFRVEGVARPLEPQVFDLLHLLVQKPGILISRDELVEAIWQGRIVSEATISTRINAVRRAVNDSGSEQRVLRTVPRRGVQLVCPVEIVRQDHAVAAPPERLDQQVRFAHSADGTLIAYATTGSGPPLVRVGHWLTHLEQDWESPIWRPFLDALGESFSVTRYDQRGSGLSARDVERLDLEAMADDLEAVVDAAGLRRFPIYAASQGVPAAISFAARHPERVSRMVLYGGFAIGRMLREDPDQRATADAMLTLLRRGWGRMGSTFVTAFTTLFIPQATPEQIESFIAMQLSSADPEFAVRLRQAIDLYDVRPVLSDLQCPVLVVHGRSDSVQPVEQARLLAASIPGAELLVLESVNHIPLPQEPAWPRLVEAIRRFAKE